MNKNIKFKSRVYILDFLLKQRQLTHSSVRWPVFFLLTILINCEHSSWCKIALAAASSEFAAELLEL